MKEITYTEVVDGKVMRHQIFMSDDMAKDIHAEVSRRMFDSQQVHTPESVNAITADVMRHHLNVK